MSKPKITPQLQEKINYYKATNLIPIELSSNLTGFRMVSGKFDIGKLDKSLSTLSIDEYFKGAWQKSRELLFADNEDITKSYTLRTSDGSLEIVETLQDETIKTYLFYFENEAVDEVSMFSISTVGIINDGLKDIKTTRKILDILATPNWEELTTQDMIDAIKSKYHWYRLKTGYGLNALWEEIKKTK